METICTICECLDNWNYETVVAERSDRCIVLFYKRSDSMSIIHAICSLENDGYIHIGNIYLTNNIVKVGYSNAIKADKITADIIRANISKITEQVAAEEQIEYADESMKYKQRFRDVMPIITQYILSANYSTARQKSKDSAHQ